MTKTKTKTETPAPPAPAGTWQVLPNRAIFRDLAGKPVRVLNVSVASPEACEQAWAEQTQVRTAAWRRAGGK